MSIERREGRRIANVSAALEQGTTTGNEVMQQLERGVLSELTQRYPGLHWSVAGEQREQQEAMEELTRATLLALFAVFLLLAFGFRSYIQPIMVMLIIPFGAIGAIAGHVLMGYNLSFISVMGMIGLSGIIVNASLILLAKTNDFTDQDYAPREAIVAGACRRFRPIILTATTTFVGLTPMIFETSVQAAFLVPMAISLGFGMLFGAAICLFMVPCAYLVFDDIEQKLDADLIERARRWVLRR